MKIDQSSGPGAPIARPIFFAVLVLGSLLVAATPVNAGTFQLFGAYWDTDEAGGAGGGGLGIGIPLGASRWQIDLKGSYYEELDNEPLEALFDDDDPVFARGLQVLPLEAGLRFNFNPEERFNFYLGGGGSYHLLDSDFGDVDDEVGGYVLAGFDLGNPDGVSFFAEGIWRFVEAKVELDPDDLDDIDDIELENRVPVDLNGIGVNAGVSWRFGGGR